LEKNNTFIKHKASVEYEEKSVLSSKYKNLLEFYDLTDTIIELNSFIITPKLKILRLMTDIQIIEENNSNLLKSFEG
jgi:hypothetical protein